jgi:hypothetical protein
VLTASIIRTIMQAVNAPETSVNSYWTTRLNIPEDILIYENLPAYFEAIQIAIN